MKILAIAVVCSSLLLGGCAGDFPQDPDRIGLPSLMVGTWNNPYAADPNLAAVIIVPGLWDFSDHYTSALSRLRPSAVSYAFWDGRVRQVQYRADGSMWDSFWWPSKARLIQGSKGWGGFDFNYGSDPTFLRHRDPRLRPASGPHA